MNAGRALIVAPRVPEFDRESGLLRVAHMIELLLDRGWEVTFGCVRTPRESGWERYARDLEQRGVETHAPLGSISDLRDPSRFDLAILVFWHVAEQFLPELRELAPSARIVVDSVDLHFVREVREELRHEPGAAPRQLGASHGDAFVRELNTYAAADAVLAVSDEEAAAINALIAQPDLALSVPDTEELPPSPIGRRERQGILLLGNFRHAPNVDAAGWLCREIVPRLDRTLLEQHRLSIVGTAADECLDQIVGGVPGVDVVGWVPSVLPYLNAARVSVVPLRYGAGTKRKIIQSLMVGTPTVTTTVGAEGLAVRDGQQLLVADDPGAFAAAIERLLTSSRVWQRLSRAGRAHVLGLHGRASVAARFDRMLETVFARPARPAPEAAEIGGAMLSEYDRLVVRVRRAVEAVVPLESRVLVASRGDSALLHFDKRAGWHFPRDRSGRYAGYYPSDSDAAIAHLEELRALGATHLVLPEPAFWWLTYYEGLREHLDHAFRLVRSDADVIVYDLTGAGDAERVATALAASNGRIGAEPETEGVQSEAPAGAVMPPRPVALAAAARYRDAAAGRRALVLGVYLSGRTNTAEHVATTIAASQVVDVTQRWAALGDASVDGMSAVTTLTVTEPTPKYALLNRLLESEDIEDYDYVLTVDDDILLPDGFLDLFLGVQESAGFAIAQPARTPNSYVDHPIVLQQRGLIARRTLFVEIGPVVSFARAIYDLVFPFDESNPMGWGFENVWARLMRDSGRPQGIVDGVPVDHSIRPPVAHYRWSEANEDRDRYLAAHPHLPYAECFRVLDVVGIES
jgi:glycosyltransferase involved in cell wall biosynthesis